MQINSKCNRNQSTCIHGVITVIRTVLIQIKLSMFIKTSALFLCMHDFVTTNVFVSHFDLEVAHSFTEIKRLSFVRLFLQNTKNLNILIILSPKTHDRNVNIKQIQLSNLFSPFDFLFLFFRGSSA